MRLTYNEQASEFINSIVTELYHVLPYCKELNYTECSVKVLNDDHSTIWVKWGPYDCDFRSLPIYVMATIADNILNR